MKKDTDTIMTSPKREVPKTYKEISSTLIDLRGVFIAIKGGGRAARNLPPIRSHTFYPLLDRLCSGRFYILLVSKCDFSRLFHSERS